MDSTYDIVFACKADYLNRQIRGQKTVFLEEFDYQNGKLHASIPVFQIGPAEGDKYMSVDLKLQNVQLKLGDISERHTVVKSRVYLQFSFTNEETIRFVCKTVAADRKDVTFGAVWVENADVDGVIQNEDLQDAFAAILAKALIEQEAKIGVVLANLKKKYFEPLGITLTKCVPAFQNLNGDPVMAVMCMTHHTAAEPSRQFSPELLSGYDFGYIMHREIFLEKFLLPDIRRMLHINSGNFKMFQDNSIVNDGNVFLQNVRVGAIDYPVYAWLIKLQFEGDHLHLLVEGTANFTGLADSYISYTFHAIRKSSFRPSNRGKVLFEPIPGVPDEYHSDKHIPLWIEITAGIFTMGLFTLISELISDAIQDRAGNLFNSIQFNGSDGGYSVTWANADMAFNDGGYAGNFYMRGK